MELVKRYGSFFLCFREKTGEPRRSARRGRTIGLAKALEPYDLFYYEDPLRPERMYRFRLIRRQSSFPIAVGDVFVGTWEGLNLITEHLFDHVRHGGEITTGKQVPAICTPHCIQEYPARQNGTACLY